MCGTDSNPSYFGENKLNAKGQWCNNEVACKSTWPHVDSGRLICMNRDQAIHCFLLMTIFAIIF